MQSMIGTFLGIAIGGPRVRGSAILPRGERAGAAQLGDDVGPVLRVRAAVVREADRVRDAVEALAQARGDLAAGADDRDGVESFVGDEWGNLVTRPLLRDPVH